MIRLLLVDDDPLILLAAGTALRADGGFAVREARTAGEALQEVAADAPDAIVTDVQLPDFDGTDLLARLRAAAATRDIPVIFLTGASGPEAERLRTLGARGVVPKPFDPFALADQVRQLLAG